MSTKQTTSHPNADDLAIHLSSPDLRSRCAGLPPLHAKLKPWMMTLCESNDIHDLVNQHGSPLNVICCAPMRHNIGELNSVAERRAVSFQLYFARKANKCLSLVDTALSAGAGTDVASLPELEQVISRNVPGSKIICTAAVKEERLLRACVSHGVKIVIDNEDELLLLSNLVASGSQTASIAIRLSGFHHNGRRLHSRFGFDVEQIPELLRVRHRTLTSSNIRIEGLHFHLDGYSANERVSAIAECLPLVDHFRSLSHPVTFLDIGGGIPMSYIDDAGQWMTFWQRHKNALLELDEPITYRNHGLGFTPVNGKLHGRQNCYPFCQFPVQADWLATILDAKCGDSTVADSLRSLELQLRCEPGRSIVDGCGITIAKVVFRKQHHYDDWYIGLAMNRTQCRTSSDDFLVDPLLVSRRRSNRMPIDGFLVGAYCTESELLSLRRLHFPRGISVGDLIVFPNTAGYFMHFLESRSHQFPLAKNIVFDADADSPYTPDDIDLQ